MTNNQQPVFSGEQLMDAARKAVYGYVKKVFPDFFRLEDVDDMVSDVMVKALDAAVPYNPERGSLFSWVWIIAKHVVLTSVEKRKRERGRFVSLDRLQYAAPDYLDARRGYGLPADSQLIADETDEMLYGSLTTPRERLIYRWLEEDLSYDEIAKRLEISKRTAYTAVCRMREKINPAA